MIAGRADSGLETTYQVQSEPATIVAQRMLHATVEYLQHKRGTEIGQRLIVR
jgi:hypothetical protein